MYQGSVAEFTVMLKLNQGVPEIGRNRFRAAFCVTFFRKKVTERGRKLIVECKTSLQQKFKSIAIDKQNTEKDVIGNAAGEESTAGCYPTVPYHTLIVSKPNTLRVNRFI